MVKLYFSSNHMSVVLFREFLTFTNRTESSRWEYQRTVKCSDVCKESDDASSIECCTYSPCGKYFAVSYDKNVIIYDTSQWDVLYVAPGERKASCINFFPKSNTLLLANKTGCATFYTFGENKLDKLTGSIGHNSMLTAALITNDEKYVITADRDEKIRVTNYPNTYNIERFCLGHKQFVCWLGFLPTDQTVLVSCSGDGTIKFWNYHTGEELAFYDCTDGSNEVDEKNPKNVIIKVTACEFQSVSILSVIEYKSNHIRVLSVRTDSNKSLSIDLVKVLELSSVPWDVTFSNRNLVCLLPDREKPLTVWSPGQSDSPQDDFTNVTNYLTDHFDSILKSSDKISDEIPVLFKRDVDNLQEYEKRKKARLERTGKTS